MTPVHIQHTALDAVQKLLEALGTANPFGSQVVDVLPPQSLVALRREDIVDGSLVGILSTLVEQLIQA